MVFRNRSDAGRRLAVLLHEHRGRDVVVFGLPRGGVVVAYEVADALVADGHHLGPPPVNPVLVAHVLDDLTVAPGVGLSCRTPDARSLESGACRIQKA